MPRYLGAFGDLCAGFRNCRGVDMDVCDLLGAADVFVSEQANVLEM